MSAEAMGWTYRHSPYRGATFAVHLAVADSVNDQHGNDLWLTQPRIAEKARVSRDAVNKAMKRLTADGFLELLEDNQRRGRANRYRFVFPEAEVAYESRFVPKAAEGVVRDDTPPGDDGEGGVATDDTPVDGDDEVDAEGVSSGTTGVQSETTPGVVTDDTEPKRTQGQPKQGSTSSRLAAQRRGDVSPIDVQVGDEIVTVDPTDGHGSFEVMWDAFPRHRDTNAKAGGGKQAKSRDKWLRLPAKHRRLAFERLPAFVAHYDASNTNYPHLQTWINERRWEDFGEGPASGRTGLSEVAIALTEALSIDVQVMTGPARGDLVSASRLIEQAGGDEGMVATVVSRYGRQWPNADANPLAIAKHWHRFAAELTHRTSGALCGRCGQPKDGHDQTTCDLLAGAA